MENSSQEYEDALSLCDLQETQSDITTDEYFNSSTQHFFEFSTSNENSAVDSVIFCGKLISCNSEVVATHDHQRKNQSRKTSSSSTSLPLRGKNLRCPSSGNNGSRKQKVMIGLAKIPSKMDLSDLRERQNRKSIPPPMFPAVVEGGELSVVSGNGSGGNSRSWALLRPFRFKAQDLTSLFARSSSFGCLRLARPCFD